MLPIVVVTTRKVGQPEKRPSGRFIVKANQTIVWRKRKQSWTFTDEIIIWDTKNNRPVYFNGNVLRCGSHSFALLACDDYNRGIRKPGRVPKWA